ncbi:hypothetical protein JL721_9951 [Aureococcus anophagefferens]|nr:hypothetical protein JL721_9951 [Aureococcus anophagefferens]
MEDFGPHHEIKMGKRQKEELAKTCSRFLDGEHIMRLRRDLRRQHGLPAAPDAALAGPAKAGRAARRGAAAAPGGRVQDLISTQVDAAAMLAHARRGGRAPVVTVLRARAPSAQFWIRAKCAQERSKARSAVRRAALAAAGGRRGALRPAAAAAALRGPVVLGRDVHV